MKKFSFFIALMLSSNFHSYTYAFDSNDTYIPQIPEDNRELDYNGRSTNLKDFERNIERAQYERDKDSNRGGYEDENAKNRSTNQNKNNDGRGQNKPGEGRTDGQKDQGRTGGHGDGNTRDRSSDHDKNNDGRGQGGHDTEKHKDPKYNDFDRRGQTDKDNRTQPHKPGDGKTDGRKDQGRTGGHGDGNTRDRSSDHDKNNDSRGQGGYDVEKHNDSDRRGHSDESKRDHRREDHGDDKNNNQRDNNRTDRGGREGRDVNDDKFRDIRSVRDLSPEEKPTIKERILDIKDGAKNIISNIFSSGKSFLSIADPKILAVKIEECHEPLIDLKEQKIISFGPSPEVHNNNDYTKMRRTVYEKLVLAQKSLPAGYNLRVYEGYRSLKLQKKLFNDRYEFIKSQNPHLKHEDIFHEATRLATPVQNLDGTLNIPPHSTGAAVDVYLVDDNGRVLDMGIERKNWMKDPDGSISQTNSTSISEEAQKNRKIMSKALEKVGFQNYPTEYWHWSYGDRYWAYSKSQQRAIYNSINED